MASAIPFGAQAGHCNSNTIVFSYVHRAFALDANRTGCSLNPDDEIDLRLIQPGSVAISVRYIGEFGPSVPSLSATINGLGFDNQVITLTRIVDPDGLLATTYDSEQITLPNGRTSSGTLTATVTRPNATTDTTCYRTAGATC